MPKDPENSDTFFFFFDSVSCLWTSIGALVQPIGSSFDVIGPWKRERVKLTEKPPSSTSLSSSEPSSAVSSIASMLWSLILGRASNAPVSSIRLLWCFLSLVVWSVAVLGLHHLRESSTEHVLQSPYEISGSGNKDVKRFDPVYRLDLSTEENYQAADTDENQSQDHFCHSKFANIRRELDYAFHKHYRCDRVLFQDGIIDSILKSPSSVSASADPDDLDSQQQQQGACTASPGRHWAVFTAGAMGAGKSFTIRKLGEKGRFPLSQFVVVDPDSIRRSLPEFARYVEATPERAGELTRKEAGKISEILTQAALERGQNVLVDGSLRNSTWYQDYFDGLRKRYPQLQIGILHITAPREAILQRAMSRAKVTGRTVPRDLLERTMVEVPESVKVLSPRVDFAVELHNAPGSSDIEIVTPSVTWDAFRRVWRQKWC